MKKILFTFFGASLLSSMLLANECQDKLKYNFTFYGAPDKSYVVTKNTFKTATSNFPNGKLLNATIDIDAFSIDTSADMSNVNGKWPASMANIRNMNTVNNFFKKFDNDIGKIHVKIVKIGNSSMNLEFKMNGATKVLPFSYKVQGDVIKGSGKLDILAFNLNKAFAQLSAVCRGFHHGKSWNELDVFFEVPANCK